MKVLCELPDLEKIIAAGKARGFEIEIPSLTINGYQVTVRCGAAEVGAYVCHKPHRKTTVLETGRWHGKSRLRISVGKRINVIGNRLGWKMAEFENVGKEDTLKFF
jgi:hypothetical protein